MRQRCSNSNNPAYKHYGGRGISVCTAWNNFTVFQRWALSSGYDSKLTIDRKNTNGNYTPHNCRWATRKEQAEGRRKQKNCTSEFIGVYRRNDTGRYVPTARLGGKNVKLGTFSNDRTAATVRDKFVKNHYNPCATLNQ